MSRRLNGVTGPGITTWCQMESADLGALRRDPVSGKIACLIGDNFRYRYLKGEWRSPSIVLLDDDHKVVALPDGSSWVKQLWPYPHNNPVFSTVLPTDFIKLGDWWYVHAMVTKGLGNEIWTEIQRSKDFINWEHTGVKFPTSMHEDRFVMWTFELWKDGFIYVYSTGGLARNKPIIMHRIPADKFPDPNAFEPWGWTPDRGWQWGNPPTPIIHGEYGELSLRRVGGRLLLSCFDKGSYSIVVRSVDSPTDNWHEAPVVTAVRGCPNLLMEKLDPNNLLTQLYGGYISPMSELPTVKLAASQWVTMNDDPYHIVMFETTMPVGPKEEEAPPMTIPEPLPPVPAEPESSLDKVAAELAESGEIPLQSNEEGPRLSLRGAISAILWKLTKRLDLGGRPIDPATPDDIFGQILSLRAEVRQLRAIVDAIARDGGEDPDKIVSDRGL